MTPVIASELVLSGVEVRQSYCLKLQINRLLRPKIPSNGLFLRHEYTGNKHGFVHFFLKVGTILVLGT
ncbi:hypothetical protein BTO04_03370 [Polaribacter sp. SA4-10]|nr:hypothetical protein BTO04_03370 [Polaribacter sp. SA4-10]